MDLGTDVGDERRERKSNSEKSIRQVNLPRELSLGDADIAWRKSVKITSTDVVKLLGGTVMVVDICVGSFQDGVVNCLYTFDLAGETRSKGFDGKEIKQTARTDIQVLSFVSTHPASQPYTFLLIFSVCHTQTISRDIYTAVLLLSYCLFVTDYFTRTPRKLNAYRSFASVELFHFNVPEDTVVAVWNLITFKEQGGTFGDSCPDRNVTVYFRSGAPPVINPLQTRFPKDTIVPGSFAVTLTWTLPNRTTGVFNVTSPLPGDWFLAAHLPKDEGKISVKRLHNGKNIDCFWSGCRLQRRRCILDPVLVNDCHRIDDNITVCGLVVMSFAASEVFSCDCRRSGANNRNAEIGSFGQSTCVSPNALTVTDQMDFWKEGAKKKHQPESHSAVSHQRAC
ncbi:hypothetical protein QQF64_027628 [Cirrhinus molitorella]|uniref:Transmembrane protein 8A n=1 Tax=Cirrhinus molitorella TaxID=172907 RepID=A0ABR3NCZ8_9TELE